MSKPPTISELRENYGRAVYQAELHQRQAALIRQRIDAFAQAEADSFFALHDPEAPANIEIPSEQQAKTEPTQALDLNTARMRLTRDIQARVAHSLGLSRAHVCLVASGHRISSKVSEALKREYATVEAQLTVQFPSRTITPLNEEFFDLFYETRRKFVNRLCRVAFTDLKDQSNGVFYLQSIKRIRILRATAVMPSVAIQALRSAIGCEENECFGIDLRLHRQPAAKVCREIGVSEEFLWTCWRTPVDVDLDAQWCAVREELLKIRAEFAAEITAKAAHVSPIKTLKTSKRAA
jgi:hypothetical protein